MEKILRHKRILPMIWNDPTYSDFTFHSSVRRVYFLWNSPNNSICSVCPFSQKAVTGNDLYCSMIQLCSCQSVIHWWAEVIVAREIKFSVPSWNLMNDKPQLMMFGALKLPVALFHVLWKPQLMMFGALKFQFTIHVLCRKVSLYWVQWSDCLYCLV